MGGAVARATDAHAEVGRQFGTPLYVRVAAEHCDVDGGMCRGKASQHCAGGTANEERLPGGVGESAARGQRLEEGWDVGRDDDLGGDGRRAIEERGEAERVGIGERLLHRQLRPTGFLRGELGDELVVVEHQWGGEGVAHATIGPAVDSDEGSTVAKGDDTGRWQPLNVGPTLGERRGAVANATDRCAVMIVIPEDIPEGATRRCGEVDQIGSEARGERDVARDDEVVGLSGPKLGEQRVARLGASVIEVEVGGPEDRHSGRSSLLHHLNLRLMTLPINAVLPELLSALTARSTAVLIAPPGAGKTTGVPLALLDAPWLAGRRIVMLEPRRLAARAAAARMAFLLGERIGETVGYRIRLESRVGPGTRIEVVTEGILTRRLQDDPELEGVGAVLFDEFHERSLAADTGLALTLASRALLRDDLRVVVMSATLDGDAVSRLLDGAPVIRSEGRAFPVTTQYRPAPAGSRLEGHVAQVVREALTTETGSVLVFLPGAGEIRRVEGMLASGMPANVSVHSLHGTLPPQQQDAAIAAAAPGQRKVVLATSIAETSLTIEGIRVVVDAGLMRIPRFSARTGMTRLETVRVSRASADQRRGRAGRLEPGSCWRCWSTADDAGLVPYTRPEMLDADLAPLALELAAAGFPDPTELRWLDAPPPAAVLQGRELLTLLGALDDDGKLTPHGRAMAALGTHPRLAHLLLRAREHSVASAHRAANLAALLEERDILRGDGGPPPADITLRLDVLERTSDAAAIGAATVDRNGLSRVRDLAQEWCRRLGVAAQGDPQRAEDAGLLLALAYPDRVAQRRDTAGRFLLRNGRGATLPLTDPLAQAPWLVAAQVDDSGRDGRILLGAALDPADLVAHAGEQVATADEIRWDDSSRSVIARRRTTLGALVFADHALGAPNAALVLTALLEGIRRHGLDALPWREPDRVVRERLAFVRALDQSWPDVSNDALLESLEEWLAPHVGGIRKLDDITRVDLAAALLNRLDWEQRRLLDSLAPERIAVPSGSRIAVDYSDPSAPVLAVRLQEMFGETATPLIGGGRVPLTLHLLSPAGRPMQVTRDLASFWATGYFDVRKDLRGRYPKHHWPENPLEAPAVRGIKRPRG